MSDKTSLINPISKHFKPYLSVKGSYKGGRSIRPKHEGDKVYKLSSNEHPFGTSPKVLEAIKRHNQNLHLYPDQNDKRLRAALAEYYQGQLNPEQFLTANSGSEILDLSFRAFLREGDEVIISNPCFIPYRTFSTWMGAKVVDIRLREPDYSLDVEGILAAVTERTRIVTVTSPNNPTGTYIPKGRFEELLFQLPDDVLLIYDEVYRQFVDAEDYTTALPYVLAGHNVMGLNSFSKTYGMAALRVGYSYTSEEIATYIRQIIKPFTLSKLSLEAAMAALDDEAFVAETAELIRRERAFLAASFKALGIRHTPSQTNFHLIDPPIPDNDFVDYLIDRGIMTRPVSNFGAPGKVRISIGTREANEALLAALEDLMRTLI